MSKLEVVMPCDWSVTESCFSDENCNICESSKEDGDRFFLEVTQQRDIKKNNTIVLIMMNPSDAGKKLSSCFHKNCEHYISDFSINLFLQALSEKNPDYYKRVAIINLYPHIASDSKKLTKDYKTNSIVTNNIKNIVSHLKKYNGNFDLYEATGNVDAKKRYTKFVECIRKKQISQQQKTLGVKLPNKELYEHIHQRIDTAVQIDKIKEQLNI
ncbi:DUF1643 domain-containing protein [Leuconostoc sp. JNUCC 76]